MSETAEILRKARALVDKGWCKGHYAETPTGNACGSDDPNAIAWCMEGALYRTCRETGDFGRLVQSSVSALVKECNGKYLPHFNDATGTTKPDVLAAFDRAIAAAEKSSG